MASIGAVVATYVDDGYSGATLNRPGLDELHDTAEAGIFDELWCLSPDRLSRSFPYQVLVLDELARLGVTVRFVDSPPIEDDPQARLLVQMQGVIAEYERSKLSERSRRGKLFRVRAGEAVFGRPPYSVTAASRGRGRPGAPGYLRARSGGGPAHLRRLRLGHLAAPDLPAPLRRRRAERLGPEDAGRPTTISGLLTNPTYMGKAAWYRTEHVTPPGGGPARRRPRPSSDWVEVKVPAIVSEATFAAAQAARANHSAFSPRRAPPQASGCCGAWWSAVPAGSTPAHQMTSSSGKIGRYYSCHHDPVLAGGPENVCRERRIRADELDSFVYDKVRELLLRPDVLLAGESALIGPQAPHDELLDTQLTVWPAASSKPTPSAVGWLTSTRPASSAPPNYADAAPK